MAISRVLGMLILGLGCGFAAFLHAGEPVRRDVYVGRGFGGLTIQIPGVGVRVDVNRGPGGVGVQVDAPGTRVDVGAPRGPVIVGEPVFEKRAYLGVFTAPVPPAVAAQVADELGEGEGLIVTDIVPGSAAATAGLRKNDLLVSYDGALLTSVAQLQDLVANDKAGRRVELEVLRAGKLRTVEVILGEKHVEVFPQPGVPADERERLESPPVPGTGIPPEPAAAVRHRTALLATSDGKTYALEVTATDATDLTSRETLTGDLEEVSKQADALPQPHREIALRLLARHADEQDKEGDAAKQELNFQLVPLIEGKQKILHLLMTRPGKEGAVRMLEVDYYFSPDSRITPADLLKVEVLQDEFGQLSVEVRGKLEETLRRIDLPEARVDVQNAQ